VTYKQKLTWVYGIVLLFIIINSLLIANEFYWFSLIPLLLATIIIYLFALDKLLLIITFLTPIAINIEFFDIGAAISIPTEPLMAGILILFIVKLFYDIRLNKKFLFHPVTVAIILYLSWLFITTLTSQIPVVSLKFLIAKLWFIIPFYVLGVELFKKEKNIRIFSWCYLIPLIGVIIYTTINHYQWGFYEIPAHWVMKPFYNDHTAYGSIIAMFIPICIGFILYKNYTKFTKYIVLLIIIILLLALILSYSRAAWISIIGAIVITIIILIRFKFRYILLISGIITVLVWSLQQEILNKLEKNKQDSSANLIEHVQSIYNISSDASNLERINRWNSAIRMFKEKPILGWGPGTYQFIYAPYQNSKDKTIISTNAGDRGNAHSEYIGPLCEAGILGLLTFVAVVISVIYTGIKVFRTSENKYIRWLGLTFLIGLITYYIHGTLNNFLDTDKASVPFWGFTAIIVALDLYHKNNKETLSKIE